MSRKVQRTSKPIPFKEVPQAEWPTTFKKLYKDTIKKVEVDSKDLYEPGILFNVYLVGGELNVWQLARNHWELLSW